MFRRIFSFIFLLCFLLQICTACTLNLPEATPVVGDVSNEQIDTIYPEWTASEIYTIGQIVIHEGNISVFFGGPEEIRQSLTSLMMNGSISVMCH